MDLFYGRNYFYFKGKLDELSKFLKSLPLEMKLKDYLRHMLH